VAFIDEHRGAFGVEPICRVLREHGVGIAPSTYRAAKTRPPSARQLRDEELKVEIARAYDENFVVYGARKIWDHLNNVDDIPVAQCTVRRLMGEMGLSGVRRGRAWVRTTISAGDAGRPVDLVDRDFTAGAPNRLWLADLTYVKTHTGWVYVAFIIDVYSRFVVGWQASRSLRSDLALDALEMAMFNRRRAGADLSGLVHHSDRGVQYLSIRYSTRLADNDIVASVGSKGDSYDNAMIESFNGLYKSELIYRKGPWRGLDDVEYATLEYVDWFNHRRRHGEILDGPRYTTPADHEATYYRQNVTTDQIVTQ
jgi:putative transposase